LPEPAIKLHAAEPTKTQAMLIDTIELAPLVGLSITTIKRLVSANQIPHVRIGRSVRFSVAGIEKWIGAGCPRTKRI
jgi:excisionase family DNA binding protein